MLKAKKFLSFLICAAIIFTALPFLVNNPVSAANGGSLLPIGTVDNFDEFGLDAAWGSGQLSSYASFSPALTQFQWRDAFTRQTHWNGGNGEFKPTEMAGVVCADIDGNPLPNANTGRAQTGTPLLVGPGDSYGGEKSITYDVTPDSYFAFNYYLDGNHTLQQIAGIIFDRSPTPEHRGFRVVTSVDGGTTWSAPLTAVDVWQNYRQITAGNENHPDWGLTGINNNIEYFKDTAWGSLPTWSAAGVLSCMGVVHSYKIPDSTGNSVKVRIIMPDDRLLKEGSAVSDQPWYACYFGFASVKSVEGLIDRTHTGEAINGGSLLPTGTVDSFNEFGLNAAYNNGQFSSYATFRPAPAQFQWMDAFTRQTHWSGGNGEFKPTEIEGTVNCVDFDGNPLPNANPARAKTGTPLLVGPGSCYGSEKSITYDVESDSYFAFNYYLDGNHTLQQIAGIIFDKSPTPEHRGFRVVTSVDGGATWSAPLTAVDIWQNYRKVPTANEEHSDWGLTGINNNIEYFKDTAWGSLPTWGASSVISCLELAHSYKMPDNGGNPVKVKIIMPDDRLLKEGSAYSDNIWYACYFGFASVKSAEGLIDRTHTGSAPNGGSLLPLGTVDNFNAFGLTEASNKGKLSPYATFSPELVEFQWKDAFTRRTYWNGGNGEFKPTETEGIECTDIDGNPLPNVNPVRAETGTPLLVGPGDSYGSEKSITYDVASESYFAFNYYLDGNHTMQQIASIIFDSSPVAEHRGFRVVTSVDGGETWSAPLDTANIWQFYRKIPAISEGHFDWGLNGKNSNIEYLRDTPWEDIAEFNAAQIISSLGIAHSYKMPDNGGNPVKVKIIMPDDRLLKEGSEPSDRDWYACFFGFASVKSTASYEGPSTVAFEANGGIPAPKPQQVIYGEKAARPDPNPRKAHFSFAGWYKDSAFTEDWDFDTDTVTGDTILYAKWKLIPGDVDGDGFVDDTDVELISNHLLKRELLENDALAAAKVTDGESDVNILDLLTVKSWVLDPSELDTLPQISGDYTVDGGVSRAVLDNYLSRAVTYSVFGSGTSNKGQFLRSGDIYQLVDAGAKYIQRAGCVWLQNAAELNATTKSNYKYSIDSVHYSHPEIVFEACLFEICSSGINNVIIPPYVLEAFEQPTQTERRFDFNNIIYTDRHQDRWGAGAGVPDITRLEAQMYFYYMATFYIDAGFEALHWGQTELMGEKDTGNAAWTKVINMARDYALAHARRGFVFNNAHSFREEFAVGSDGLLLYDFHASPTRLEEVAGSPMECVINAQSDAIYGNSAGGTTHSGWVCTSLPFLAELDNYGGIYQNNITSIGQTNPDPIWNWGYDEISWFSNQSDTYRRSWLHYAYTRVSQLDTAGHFSMPGFRPYFFAQNGEIASSRYDCLREPFSDSATIKAIWTN